MNVLPVSALNLHREEGGLTACQPMSLSERVASALQDVDDGNASDLQERRKPSNPHKQTKPMPLTNPLMIQFVEWMFFGEPEETGMENLEPHI